MEIGISGLAGLNELLRMDRMVATTDMFILSDSGELYPSSEPKDKVFP